MQARMHNLLFVGVSRAIKWVFISGTNGRLINPLIDLGQRDTRAFLETQLADGAGDIFNSGTSRETAPAASDEFGLD